MARNQKFVLGTVGGALGKDAQWKWYAGDCQKSRLLGTGPLLSLKLRKSTLVFLKAAGTCGETACTTAYITVSDKNAGVVAGERQWDHAFNSAKFLHLGYGFGLDYQHAAFRAARQFDRPLGRPDSLNTTADGFGLLGELTAHPLLKNGFSLGLRSSAALGTGLYGLLDPGEAGERKKFTYYEFRLGGELAVGHRLVKLLLTQEHRAREYRFESRTSDWTATQNDKSYFVKLGAGVRLGAYGRLKPANTVDVLAYLQHQTAGLAAGPLYANVGSYHVGAGLHWWHHNKFGLRVEAVLQNRQRDYNILKTSFNNAQVNASLVLRQDFFR